MAAPAVPTATQLGKGFFQNLIENITIASNLSLPTSFDASQTGVLSSTTATQIINCLTTQRDLL